MRKISLVLSFLMFAVGLWAQGDFPEPLTPPRLVNDFTQLLSVQERQSLEQKLRAYHDSTSTQIYVVVLNDLHGYEIADYTTQLADRWGVGQKDRDNGVMILIKNKVGNERGQVFIATGYGLEGVLPDALVKRIVETEIIPRFAQGEYYGGIDAAIDAIIASAAGEYKGLPPKEGDSNNTAAGWAVLLIVFLFFYRFFIRKKSGSGCSGCLGGFIPFGGGFGGGSSGGRGFGGGGGGRFGGGGAGGSW